MSQAVRITFVRHGESLSNHAQRWQGQGDSPLSELGRKQARALGQRLAGRRFDRVVASDLARAVDTARATGFAFEQERALREFDVGVWEGLTRDEVATRYPEEIARLKAGEDLPLGGGESFATFSLRVDAALARLRDALEPGQHALVVCHGGVIGAALSGLLGLRGGRRFPLASASNTSISEVVLSGERRDQVLLRVFNDARHIAELTRWPTFEIKHGCMALVCDGPPASAFGRFEAHYDAHGSLLELSPDEQREVPALRLRSVMSALGQRHPEQRVSVSAPADVIHSWASSALWPEPPSSVRLDPPRSGQLCHVGSWGEGPVLQDYGVSLADD
ncbi:MAG: histidine phosphatase family protein [Myxococcales bacterium]